MKRFFPPIAFIILLLIVIYGLISCLSTETQAKLDRYEKVAASASADYQAALKDNRKTQEEIAAIKAKLDDAMAKLSIVKTEAVNERLENGANIAGQTIEGAKTIAGYLFPPALVILNLLGNIAGNIGAGAKVRREEAKNAIA